MQINVVFACGVALFVGACSTAADYKPVIGSFADATNKAQQALQSYDAAAADRITDIRKGLATSQPRSVRPLPDDCLTSSQRCRVAFFDPQGGEPKSIVVQTVIPNHVAAMREISLYAASLNDVVMADSTPAVKTAVEKAGAAISSLASLLAPGSAPAANALAVPIEQGLTWLYGKYQESIKVRALRDATAAMDPVLSDAVAKFGTAANLAELSDLRRLARDVNAREDAFDRTSSVANLESLLSSADKFDQALRLSPQDVFNRLGDAHKELTRALRDENISLADAFQRIDRLSADADALFKIAKAFQQAAKAQ